MATQPVSPELLLDHLQDGVCFVDSNHIITYWSRGAERITGLERERVLGHSCTPDRLGHLDATGEPLFPDESPLEQSIARGIHTEKEVFLTHSDGHRVPVFTRVSPIFNGHGVIMGAMEVFSDNHTRLQALERIKELEEMALLCPLTEVGNRRYTEMALSSALDELKRYARPFGMLFVDIDHFKPVNDTYGHNVGDQILRMVSHGLRSGLRSFDFVGRWGGEEFVVLLPNVDAELLRMVAERCHRIVGDSEYHHDGNTVRVTASMGGILGRPGEDVARCIERADRLLYRSKHQGRNRITIEI